MIVIILRCEYTSNTLINRENTESTGAFIRFYTRVCISGIKPQALRSCLYHNIPESLPSFVSWL